jgi:hypothetical protein
VALSTAVGSITQPGGTGSQSYNVGFTPKALLLQCVARTANGGGSANAAYSYGWATDRGGTPVQRFFFFGSQDNIGTAQTLCGSGAADIIKMTDGATTTVDLEVAFVEFTADSFTLDWQNLHTTASILIQYCAIGGDDVEDALAGTFSIANAATMDVTVTAGFGQPSLIFFGLSWNGADPPVSANGADTCFGWGVKAAGVNGRCIRWGSTDAATTQASQQGIFNNRSLNLGDSGAIDTAFQMSGSAAWPTDGFEITRNNGTAVFAIPYLAIKLSTDVTVTDGEATAATVLNGTNTLTSSGTPKLAIVANTRQTTANAVDSTSTNAMMFGIGVVDGSGNEWYAGAYDDDAQASASVTGTYQTDAKGIQTWLPSTNALDGEADIAVSGSDFVATWTDQAPSAFLYEWVTLGEAAAAATSFPPVRPASSLYSR